MIELNQLRVSLTRIFHDYLPASASLENAEALKRLKQINRWSGGLAYTPSRDGIASAVAAYRYARQFTSFRDMKYVCYGATLSMQDGWSVMGDDELRSSLFAGIAKLSPARQLKCYQALLRSYFSYALFDEANSSANQMGWEALRDWLANKRQALRINCDAAQLRLPSWCAMLDEHANLLTKNPCERYGAALLEGEGRLLEEVREGLSLAADSWVLQAAILAQLQAAAALADAQFNSRLEALIKLSTGQMEVTPSVLLQRRAVAMLVGRYARCAVRPEHAALRDAAVAAIGNPWLKRSAWDAAVKSDDGQPDNAAREMVKGWFTRRLIADFFSASDDPADQRRQHYWSRFEPVIEDIWLALGADAYGSSAAQNTELRARATGRLLRLENQGLSNSNALILKVGSLLVVEFSGVEHACYIYQAAAQPFSLAAAAINLQQLKVKALGVALRHVDSYVPWEKKFDGYICPYVDFVPENSPAATAPDAQAGTPADFDEEAFWQLIRRYSLIAEDRRDDGAGLWVRLEYSPNPSQTQKMITQWLTRSGFQFKPHHGWWRA